MAEWYKEKIGMADYLPQCLNENAIFVQLCKGVDRGFKDLQAYAAKAAANCCLDTADETIISRYEKIFGLSSKGLALEYRRERIKCRLRQRPPINEVVLKNMMSGVFGEITKIYQNEEDYSITVKYREQTGFEDFDFAKNLLRKVVPANLLLDVLYSYAEWQSVKPYTWNVVKGYSWKQLLSQEITEN